ncbi:MAG: dipeptidase PepV [Firmicutes bacterium]|nr:dipeptidase PepV [Bacillota bacterium]
MDFEKLIEGYKKDIIEDTQKLVKIKSVQGDKKEGMPFGEGPNKALEYTLNLAERLGFKTENFDGYAGHAEIGEGKEVVGILAHLDVVPEGEGWTYPPYSGEIHDNKIYGRGTIDDKGPAIASLYAMKAIKESNVKLNKRVRIIFGTNEETGWGGINYYLKKVKEPDLAFTPDAEFPVIHGEKGIMIFNLVKEFNKKVTSDIVIKNIKGGNAPNMVPDSCIALLDVKEEKKEYLKTSLDNFIDKTGFKMSLEENNEIKIISKGISAHGSMPESGQNAISQLIKFLATLDLDDSDVSNLIKFYDKKIGMEYYGQSIGCGLEDDLSGKLIFNVGVIDLNEDKASISVNIRYPIKYDEEIVYNGMKKELKDLNIRIDELDHMKPIYVEKDHELVKKLMKVYKSVTGDQNSDAITIGGGTYARAMSNAVAFGPLFPGKEELAHQKDEYISIDDLIKCSKIFTKAIYELAK